jgi:hypothetical protein
MTDIVERIKVGAPWTNDKGEQVVVYRVTLVNETGQREVPCYSPLGKDLKEDTPLPEGWEVKTSKAGKPYLAAPRVSGGGRSVGAAPAAWRNTEAGAKYEQERMDRRTALMQAVALHGSPATDHAPGVLNDADEFYAWLRQSVSAPREAGMVRRPDGRAGVDVGADTPSDGGGGQLNSPAHREAAPPSSAKRHEAIRELGESTQELGGYKRTPNQPPPGWDQ